MGRHLHSLLIPSLGVLFTASLTAFALAATSAGAYPVPVDFDGSLMRWNITPDSDPVSYAVEADLEVDVSRFASDIDDAAVLWGEVPGSYFALAQVAPGATPQITIFLERALDGARFSAGYALFDQYDGKDPLHCAIHVGVDDGTTHAALAKTVLHELGHCAGLGHTLVPEAIMSYSLDRNAFALDLDDEAAVSRLYPADGSTPKLPPGCAVGAELGGASPPVAALLLALPTLLAALLALRGSPAFCRWSASPARRRRPAR
jgi:hypothetical protein